MSSPQLNGARATPSFLSQCLLSLAKFIKVPSLFVVGETGFFDQRSEEMCRAVSQLDSWLKQLPEPLFDDGLEATLELEIGGIAPELVPSQELLIGILQRSITQVSPASYNILRPMLLFLQQYVLRQQQYAEQLQLLAVWLAPLMLPILCSKNLKRGHLLVSVLVSQAMKIFEGAAAAPGSASRGEQQSGQPKQATRTPPVPAPVAKAPDTPPPTSTIQHPAVQPAAHHRLAAAPLPPALPTVFARPSAVFAEHVPSAMGGRRRPIREAEIQHQDSFELDPAFCSMLDSLVGDVVASALFSDEDLVPHMSAFSNAAITPTYSAASNQCANVFAEVRTPRQLVTAAGGATHMPRSPLRPAIQELRRSLSAPPGSHSPPSGNVTPRAGMYPVCQPSQHPAIPMYGQVMTAAQVAARMLSRRSDSGVSRGGADIFCSIMAPLPLGCGSMKGSPPPASPPPALPDASHAHGCLSPTSSVVTPACLGLRPINTQQRCGAAVDVGSSPDNVRVREPSVFRAAAAGLTVQVDFHGSFAGHV